MSKKPIESFRKYTQRWPYEASQSSLRLQMKSMLPSSGNIAPTHYDCLICQAGASFANLVQSRERTEDGLKTDKLQDYQEPF